MNISWTPLPPNQIKGFYTFIIEFSVGGRKRQAGGGVMECTMSGCRVPYEQGGVTVRGFSSDQHVVLTIRTENGEMESGVSRTLTSVAIEQSSSKLIPIMHSCT